MENLTQTLGIKGEITAKFYDQTTLVFWQKQFNKFIDKFKTKYPKLMRFYRLGKLTKTDSLVN